MHNYQGADKSLAQPTSQCILFDGENISFDASTNIILPHNLHTSHLDPPYRPLTPYIFAPQVGLNLPQPPQWDPHNE